MTSEKKIAEVTSPITMNRALEMYGVSSEKELREFKNKASSNVALKSAATFYESKWGKKNILCFKNEFEKKQ